ncbi:MAG TPA: recombination protein NinG [Bacteroidales bacterium]|nr:recombination protein NinG [Bacteroidales bacterium]
MKRKTKSLPKLKADCQKIFNEYIRLRDQGRPCISCGLMKPLQAGHYFPTQGYDGLRFNEDNVHGECAGCNCFDESHLIHYGRNLWLRIGRENVEYLAECAQEYKHIGYKWSRSELIELIEKYKAKVKELRNQKTIC